MWWGDFSDPEKGRENPDMQKFIAWVSKKPPEFYDRSVSSSDKKRKKRRL